MLSGIYCLLEGEYPDPDTLNGLLPRWCKIWDAREMWCSLEKIAGSLEYHKHRQYLMGAGLEQCQRSSLSEIRVQFVHSPPPPTLSLRMC